MLVGWCSVAEVVSCGQRAIRRCAERRVIALTTSLLMWLVAFLDVGGEWFLMWQSKIWNGQEEAFRMFTIVGVVFLVVVQREPTPD
jgi:predicted small integral membrane protein